MTREALKVFIIDDEPLAAANLLSKVSAILPDALITTLNDPLKAIAMIEQTPPDIALLDIEMPRLSGFDVLQNLPEGVGPKTVIFCTAYPEHALKAFEHAALDYIVKPVEPDRLRAALERATQRLAEQDAVDTHTQYLSRLVVNTNRGKTILELSDVACFISEEHQTVAYTTDREFVCDLSLTKLEERTDPNRFVRVHRSAILQVSFLKEFNRDTNTATMSTGRQIPVSRRQRTVLLDLLKD